MADLTLTVTDALVVGETTAAYVPSEVVGIVDAVAAGDITVVFVPFLAPNVTDSQVVDGPVQVRRATSGAAGAVPLVLSSYVGDFAVGTVVSFMWNTFDGVGESIAPVDAGVIQLYRTNSILAAWQTPRAALDGILYQTSFGGNIGLNAIRIDLADNTDLGFYAVGGEYQVDVVGLNVDDSIFNGCLFTFSIERVGAGIALMKDFTHLVVT